MSFIKGVMIGTAVGMTASVMYKEGMINKKKMIKQGKKWAKKIGIM